MYTVHLGTIRVLVYEPEWYIVFKCHSGIKISHNQMQNISVKKGLSFQMADIVKAVGNCSYNQLVEKIICCKQADNKELVNEGG